MDARQPDGYTSATECSFSQDQADAIVRVAAYHRRDFERSVKWFPAREHVGIRQSIATSFPRTPNTRLGTLDRLPLELVHEILLSLDVQSLFNFRQANLSSRQTVDSLHQYQRVVAHGLRLFCALLRTRLAVGVSLSDFYQALCTKACGTCGGFGGFVSLLEWHRCCAVCVRGAMESQLQPVATIQEEFNFTEAEVGRLKTFNTLPGIYTMAQSVHISRVEVASVYQAVLAAGSTHEAFVQATMWRFNPKFNFAGACALPYYDRATDTENGVSCAGCCLAFLMVGKRWARNMVYARDSFLDHFRWCKQAQILWTYVERGRHEGATRAPKVCSGRRALQESRMSSILFRHGANILRWIPAATTTRIGYLVVWSPCEDDAALPGLAKGLGTRCIRVPAPLLRVSQTASRASSSSKPAQPQDVLLLVTRASRDTTQHHWKQGFCRHRPPFPAPSYQQTSKVVALTPPSPLLCWNLCARPSL